ncbi:autotransporter domain-containing protein [Hyphobacterium sp.]|uniref:autotransporter domain-containing protein n=1 Tax=Hyphobacterium sp. TaxID=2004662 RepID=UPI003748668C
MRNRFLISTALCAAFVSAPVFADTTVDDERNDGIRTSTINDGAPDNLIIGANGRVTITTDNGGTGPLVTVDSDNTFLNSGTLEDTTGDDGATGVLVNGGTTGGITNNGRIAITGAIVSNDEDGDGDNDGPFANASNRAGILIVGPGTFIGDVLNTESGVIDVIGNDSAGIRLLTMVDGNLTSLGTISITGENSYGIDLAGGLSGDFIVDGTISTTGPGSGGIRIRSDVGGAFVVAGQVNSTAYRYAGNVPDNFQNLVDEDDTLLSDSAITVGGNIANGIFLAGTDYTGNGTNASIASASTAPAFWIAPELGNGNDIVIGNVFIGADPDVEGDEDITFNYGFVNRGVIAGEGRFGGFNSTALRISGSMIGNVLRTTTIEGGVLNENLITSRAHEAEARSVEIGNGAILPVFENSGGIRATATGQNSNSIGLIILAGANVPIIRNASNFFVENFGVGSATAIVDQSNTVGLIENTGLIFSTLGSLSTEVQSEPDGTASGEPISVVNRTAIDVSRSTIDVTFRQLLPDVIAREGSGQVRGDIRFGSGNDFADIQGGLVEGDIYFGDGADRLSITGDAAVVGAIDDSDGDLEIFVENGQLELQNTSSVNIRQATFNDGARLVFEVDTLDENSRFITASDTVTFNEGSTVTATLANLIGEGAEYIVLEASNLVINSAIDSLQDANAPYLYNTTLARDANNPNQLVLTLRRKTSDELGMHANRAAAYSAAFAAWSENERLGAAFASLSNSADFFEAYDQLLPEYAASAIQFAVASNDSAIGALSGRLDAARRSPDGTGGIWLQEFGYFADREQTSFGPGYRGQGVGIAGGVDRPMGPFYAVGVNFVGAASEIEESNGVDQPMTALTGQIGVYGGVDFGSAFAGEFYAGAGVDSFETERRVLIGVFDQTSIADWTGYHYAASARFARDFEMGRWYARPSLSIDYLRLYESAYSETGGGAGIDLIVDDRESSTFSSTASFTLGGLYGSPSSWWSPQVRLGYRNDFSGDPMVTNARFAGYNNEFSFRSEDLPGSGFIFGLALQAGSDYSTFSFDYDADLRDGFVRHTARLVLRLVF